MASAWFVSPEAVHRTLREDSTGFTIQDVVTLDEAKAHLKIDNDDEDAHLNLLIEAVTRLGESYMDFDFRATRDAFYITDWPINGHIEIPKRRTKSFVVKQFFAGSYSVTVADTVYHVSGGTFASVLSLKEGQEWPDHSTTATDIVPGRVLINFETTNPIGLVDKAVPEHICKLGVLTHLAHVYEHRGDCDLGSMPGSDIRNSMYLSGAAAIYAPWRLPNV